MPKKKEPVVVVEPRVLGRRQASKEALKQLQRISEQAYDSPETLEICSEDEEVVAVEPLPKKKYKLSHRKSADDRDVLVLRTVNYDDHTLVLDSWTEELSAAQIAMRNSTKKEIDDINARLEKLLKDTKSEVIQEGDHSALYELEQELKQTTITSTPSTTKATPQAGKGNQGLKLVMDPRSGVVVGTMTPTLAPLSTPTTSATKPQTRKRTRGAANLPTTPASAPPAKVAKPTVTPPAPSPSPAATQPSQRATEATSVGGLLHGNTQRNATVVDLTTDDCRSAADSREVSFNKLQGKTFPSLVVVARPHLRAASGTTASVERAKLDSKVKAVLMHPATKFTEWLIQAGLIRSEQTCTTHPQTKLKLGMYSDVSKFPFSGGYVWISECCPQRFVSVFSGSLFEGSPHPPSVILKLIYHWACQTNVQNVVQWVKVDNLYIKGLNTWLRATCTAALHTHIGVLGGPGKKVEVGVISLGTTSQDGQQRQVKVEVLGVLEVERKLLRLRAVEPLTANSDKNYRKRFSKILEPLMVWVHPDSSIVTDLTVDKGTLQSMGYKNIFQSTSTDTANNHTIMEYLRRIVPRMFQNTLSLLSRQIIQQFLDELVWREWFGTSATEGFDNIVLHLSEQTKVDGGQNLVQRLNKIAGNPFKNWSIKLQLDAAAPTSAAKPSTSILDTTKKTYTRQRKAPASHSPVQEVARPQKSVSPDIPEQTVPLEHYYYGTIEGLDSKEDKAHINIKCNMCKSQFTNNIQLMQHLFTHGFPSHNVGSLQCKYCLIPVSTKEGLVKHISSTHMSETKNAGNFVCVICEGRFFNTYSLGKHMCKEHVPSELPYQCGTCYFRCSSHKQAVDHFYNVHNGGNTMQCPLCLKSTCLTANGRVLTQNLNYFLQHLHKHQKKAFTKKCPKCSLWFIQKEFLKDHLQKLHTSQRRKAGLVPWPVPRVSIMVPKSRQEEPQEQEDVNISKVVFVQVSDKLKCRECDTNLSTKGHFPSVQNCSNDNCQFSTCCRYAMHKHASQCAVFHMTLPVQKLPFKMHCVCGYSDFDGNQMAKHLAVCERTSAYPSEEAAKAATVTHSMLDVLGLVRRPEEPTATAVIDIMDVEEKDAKDAQSTSAKATPDVDIEVTETGKEDDIVDVAEIVNLDDVEVTERTVDEEATESVGIDEDVAVDEPTEGDQVDDVEAMESVKVTEEATERVKVDDGEVAEIVKVDEKQVTEEVTASMKVDDVETMTDSNRDVESLINDGAESGDKEKSSTSRERSEGSTSADVLNKEEGSIDEVEENGIGDSSQDGDESTKDNARQPMEMDCEKETKNIADVDVSMIE